MKIMITIALLFVAGCTSAGKVADCAEVCRGLDMRLAYVEVNPYSMGGAVESCTCAAPEQ